MIHSKELEKQLLAALIQHPSSYSRIAPLINEEDFCTGHGSYVHQTIFKFIKRMQESGSGDSLDEVVLIERLKNASISFVDNIDIGDYVRSLLLKKVSKEAVSAISLELKTYTVRRGIEDACDTIQKEVRKSSSKSLPDIIRRADSLYNDKIDYYSGDNLRPENIYEDMLEVIEDLADNPQDPGMLAPHMPFTNRMYGSLIRPGNMAVICARTGVGKTTICLDFVTEVSAAYDNVPVLHFDNGEMSKLELQMRQCSALSGVPLYLLERGLWKNSSYIDPETRREYSPEETRKKVYDALQEVKTRSLEYYNVGGYTVDEMIQTARRFYYSKVGRGNPMILSFDYIKLTNESNPQQKSTWDLIGEMIDKFKQFIQREITFNGAPMIGMITSVQANRSAILGNRNSDTIDESEGIIAGSDKINSFCTHLFYLRKRLPQELDIEPYSYRAATHRFKCLKHRHLGEDPLRATEPVAIPVFNDDGEDVGNNRLEDNAILLRINNFKMQEIGDLRDMAQQMRVQNLRPNEDGERDEFTP